MTSFGATEIKEGNFIPAFKVWGQEYHRIDSIMADLQQKPSFLQIYFVGVDNIERDHRYGIFTGVKPDFITNLENSFTKIVY
ncbi:unnamed protein product [Euphydryas editha]|uniref:Uncharacterized protein n=1 Tax=Euphydryas editha TaxID=104508 RepID=A0AAU9U2R8_EUPED|nr:unnamed protein product [Euphydryas editha]